MTVALFTPFSPDSGAGSIVIKSLLPELSELGIVWYYLAPRQARSYPGIWLGTNFSPLTLVTGLAVRLGCGKGGRSSVAQIVSRMEADSHWVVAQDEGVCIAADLVSLGKKVHLTVHDDPAALFARSRKYRLFQWLVSIVFARLLKTVSSIDVISAAMSERYWIVHGVESFPVLRYLPALPAATFSPVKGMLRVGHIGSLYQASGFRFFLEACRSYAAQQNLLLRIVRIGSSPQLETVACDYPELFETAGHLKEEMDAIRLAATCDFVYAMYPFNAKFKLFRQTSFPLKLTAYVQAQRPIFAHTPRDSSLASAVSRYQIGEVCSSNNSTDIEKAIWQILHRTVDCAAFESFRVNLLGLSQVSKLRSALSGGVGQTKAASVTPRRSKKGRP